MPIRDYSCKKCGEKFEAVYLDRKEDDANPTETCPSCNEVCTRIPTAPSVSVTWNPNHVEPIRVSGQSDGNEFLKRQMDKLPVSMGGNRDRKAKLAKLNAYGREI